MLNNIMFKFKPITRLTTPSWLEGAKADIGLQREHPEHIAFLDKFEQIENIHRIPQLDRINTLNYLMQSIAAITLAHQDIGTILYHNNDTSDDPADNPVKNDEFTREINAIRKLCETLRYSDHMYDCFKDSYKPILEQLKADPEWLKSYKNWQGLEGEDRYAFVQKFYQAFCDYFTSTDQIVTEPKVMINQTFNSDHWGLYMRDNNFDKEQLDSTIQLSRTLNDVKPRQACGLMFHEGVHLIFNHLHFFTHKDPIPSDHKLAEDLRRSQQIGQHYMLNGASFVKGMNHWHPEEHIAYASQGSFQRKLFWQLG